MRSTAGRSQIAISLLCIGAGHRRGTRSIEPRIRLILPGRVVPVDEAPGGARDSSGVVAAEVVVDERVDQGAAEEPERHHVDGDHPAAVFGGDGQLARAVVLKVRVAGRQAAAKRLKVLALAAEE
jgi:hypothetical protein